MYLLEACSTWTIMSAYGSIIASGVAFVYTILTYLLLRKTNQTFRRTNTLNEFEIYRQISASINTDLNRDILFYCRTMKLEIIYSDDIKVIGSKIKSLDINLLLNTLEDLAIFWEKKLISIEIINKGLGYKILQLGNCQAIIDHISKERAKMPNVFSEFEKLYSAVYKDSTPEEQKGYRSELVPKVVTKPIAPKAKTSLEA